MIGWTSVVVRKVGVKDGLKSTLLVHPDISSMAVREGYSADLSLAGIRMVLVI